MKNKKKLISAIIIISVIILTMVAFFVYRNLNEEPLETVEQSSAIDTQEALTQAEMQTQEGTETKAIQGTFVDADAVHSGAGTAVITETADGPVLVFKSDFQVTNGPDLFVYLSPNTSGDPLGDFASLGKLKSNSGEQVYTLPDNYQDFESVIIWCRAFGTKFSYADLN